MSDVLSGLESMGLGNLSNIELFDDKKAKAEAEKKKAEKAAAAAEAAVKQAANAEHLAKINNTNETEWNSHHNQKRLFEFFKLNYHDCVNEEDCN